MTTGSNPVSMSKSPRYIAGFGLAAFIAILDATFLAQALQQKDAAMLLFWAFWFAWFLAMSLTFATRFVVSVVAETRETADKGKPAR
jgi:hypothetical protein